MTLLGKLSALIGAIKADFNGLLAVVNSLMGAQQFTQRIYLYNDSRWIAVSDPNFGFNDVNATQQAATGTATEPTVSWIHQGLMLSKGTVLRRLQLSVRVNNAADITALKLRVLFAYPSDPARHLSGVDNVNELTVVTLLSTDDLHGHGWAEGVPSAAVNDRITVSTDFGGFTAPEHGHVLVYVQPVRTGTSTRYAYVTHRWYLGLKGAVFS